MGLLDNFLGDIRRAADSIDAVKSGAGKVVEAIDTAEEKINNLPTEEEIKEKLKQKLNASKNTSEDKESAS